MAPRRPAVPLPPGQALAQWLREAERTQAWLAAQLGVTVKHVNEIVHDRTGFSPELAVRIAAVTKSPTRYWLDLQNDYKLHLGSR
jgi:addiction module HigA family antidote